METPQNTPSSALDRRTLVRGAAWSVPTITLASAAPAFATSGDQIVLSLVSQEWKEPASSLALGQELHVLLKVENLSSTAVAPGAVVNLTFDGAWTGVVLAFDPIDSTYGSGWSASSVTGAGSAPRNVTLTLGGLPAGASSVVGFRVRRVSASNIPYGEFVGTQLLSTTADVTVHPDSINGFNAAPKPGPISLDGSCGGLGLIAPGFTLTAGNQTVPAGSVITVTTDGLVNADVLPVISDANNTAVPGLADLNVIGEKSYTVTLKEPLTAGTKMHIRYVLSVNLVSRQTAVLTPPAGHSFPAGSKTSGQFSSTLVLCISG